MKHRIWKYSAFWLLATILIAPLHGESVSGANVAAALRTGGYVILMRHASSPRSPPDEGRANADNPSRERQLDEVGRSSAKAFGESLRKLGIPIGQVLSSPTYRALETVKFAQLGQAATFSQLGDSGQSMTSDSSGARGQWLRAKAAEPPAPAKNTVIVTHFPNIQEAYPQDAAGLADGEALILQPDGRGAARLLARVRIEDWSRLEAMK